MTFSGAVKLTDLDDFLTPAQACVKPLIQPRLIKTTERATATVSLSDCLSCSGCVTSAETVLLREQSLDRVIAALKVGQVVMSLSEQSIASVAHARGGSLSECFGKLSSILRSKGVLSVLDMQQSRDLTLRTSISEFLDRYPSRLPLICSECPGWVCYAEKKADPAVLPLLSTTKSPMLVQDYLVKSRWPECTHVCVLPCYDKKLEAHRVSQGPIVITTRELEDWVSGELWDEVTAEQQAEISTPGFKNLASHGYAEVIFAAAALHIFNRRITAEDINWKVGPKRDWAVLFT